MFRCCDDGITPAQGPNKEGCSEFVIITPKPELGKLFFCSFLILFRGYVPVIWTTKKRVEFVVIIFITTAWYFCCYTLPQWCNIYRISTILKVEIDIIAYISASSIGWAGIFVIMSVEDFRTDVTVFIGDVIMCFTPDWPINLCMRVTNWTNIFLDQIQFSDPDFISGTQQRENVQFIDN